MKTKEALKVSISEEFQTLEELLESIKKLSSHVIEDNKISSEFPTHIRLSQTSSLVVLSKALNETVQCIFEKEREDSSYAL